MKKVLLVVCVVMLGGLMASAQLVKPTTYNRTYSGFCNGFHLVLQKLASSGEGSSKIFLAGYDDLVDACGFSLNAVEVGMKHGVSASTPPHFGQTGAVLDVGDTINDDSCNCYSQVAVEQVADLVDGTWAVYEAFLGFDGDYFVNFGYLTNGLPSKAAPSGMKTNIGTFSRPTKK